MNRISAFLLLVLLSPVMVAIGLIIFVFDGFPIHFKQKRVGHDNQNFWMFKFRTMKKNTPNLPTHLLKNPNDYISPIGKLLRRFSLDELPNLINIFLGEMNFIGPRPALYNQIDLIEQRTRKNVHTIKPGITGWAQINGRDELPIPKKVELDSYYLHNRSFNLDLKIIIKTIFKSFSGVGVKH